MLAELLAEDGTGLLITLDEIHQNQIEEMREDAFMPSRTLRPETGARKACPRESVLSHRSRDGGGLPSISLVSSLKNHSLQGVDPTPATVATC